MASLQARSPLRSAHPLFFINKVVSLSAFMLMLGAGWVTVSYLKSGPIDHWRGDSESLTPSKNNALPVTESRPSEARPLIAPVRVVYSCSADKDHYHASTHLPPRCERTALGEEAAVARGLKRCRICLPE